MHTAASKSHRGGPGGTSGDRPGSDGHGWWPYVGPYFAFLGTVEVTRRLPDEWALAALLLKPAVPAALLIYFAARGEYPELRNLRPRPVLLADVAVGLALAALWMGPYVLFAPIRPAEPGAFDPEQLGPDLVALALGLRLLGYGLVTPFFEEIFIRSFVMRVSDVFQRRGDFRQVPLARYTRTSFLATVVIFTMGHVPWEYWVAVPWVVLTNLWFYHRKDLYAVILVHATTNAAILLFVVGVGGSVSTPDGSLLSLWFFV